MSIVDILTYLIGVAYICILFYLLWLSYRVTKAPILNETDIKSTKALTFLGNFNTLF